MSGTLSSRPRFIGFSTIDSRRIGDWRLYDAALVRRDLLNHFHTRIGERVMRPEFGCRIWDYLMEPMTPENERAIVEEARRVVLFDPRCEVVQITTNIYDNAIRVSFLLNYAPLGVQDSFAINFERSEDIRLSGGF